MLNSEVTKCNGENGEMIMNELAIQLLVEVALTLKWKVLLLLLTAVRVAILIMHHCYLF